MTKPSPPIESPSSNSWTALTVPDIISAHCIATVRDFVVVGGYQITPNTTDYRYSIRWCAIGDPTDWPIPATDDARAKQAGSQAFPTKYGQVTAIAGNDFYMYIFQTDAITKGTYVGGDVVWNFDIFEEDRGCVAPGMMEQIDDMVIFESRRGRHILLNDQIADIGFGITDDTH